MRCAPRTLLALAVAGVASLLAAPGADAVPPAATSVLVPSTFHDVYVTADVPPATGIGTATAPCGPGESAVSAGALTSAPGGGADGLNEIRPGFGYFDAVASARVTLGASRWVEAQVTCAPNAQVRDAIPVTSRAQAQHSPTGDWTQVVNCPAGMRAFAGGGYFQAADGSVSHDAFFMGTNSLVTGGQSWRVAAVNNTFTDRLIVTAKCLPQAGFTPPSEVSIPMVKKPGSSIGYATGYARCPAGQFPISGGVVITPNDSPSATHPQITASLRVDSGQVGWFGAGYSGGTDPRLHVIVTCH